MSCIITFDDDASTGVFTSTPLTTGVITLLGYSTTEAGPFGAGGNWPWTTNSYGASVDVSNVTEGYYQFSYAADLPIDDPCYGEVTFIVAVVQGTGNGPSDVAINVCSGDAVRNIFDDSGLFDVAAVNGLDMVLSGDTDSDGYAANGAGVEDDTFNPNNTDPYPQTVVYTITYTPVHPAGFDPLDCTNCDPETVTITYNVTEEFDGGAPADVSVCNDGD